MTNGNLRRWAVDAGEQQDDRGTHPLLFAELEERYGRFTLDVAASAANTKCEKYFTRDQDGLEQDWAGERVWCNPPYSTIAPWIRKAWDSWASTSGIVMLLPNNRAEQGWWQLMVEPYRDRPGSPLTTQFLPGRPRFLRPGQTAIGPGERTPFGCVVLAWSGSLVYRPDRVAGGLFQEATS